MKPEIKEKWLAALRSGDYKQGEGRLHISKDEHHLFCCLGVLCDIYLKEQNKEWGKIEHDGASIPDETSFIIYAVDGESRLLPHPVVEWSGLARVVLPSGVFSLVTLNDTKHNFIQIADDIEKGA